jgi:hypothetical protein
MIRNNMLTFLRCPQPTQDTCNYMALPDPPTRPPNSSLHSPPISSLRGDPAPDTKLNHAAGLCLASSRPRQAVSWLRALISASLDHHDHGRHDYGPYSRKRIFQCFLSRPCSAVARPALASAVYAQVRSSSEPSYAPHSRLSNLAKRSGRQQFEQKGVPWYRRTVRPAARRPPQIFFLLCNAGQELR